MRPVFRMWPLALAAAAGAAAPRASIAAPASAAVGGARPALALPAHEPVVPERAAGVVRGTVTGANGAAAGGALVTARREDAGVAVTVPTDGAGRYRIEGLEPGVWRIEVRAPGHQPFVSDATVAADRSTERDVRLAARPDPWEEASAAEFLTLLPDGPEKRAFILDCAGCHPFDARIVGSGDGLRSRTEWEGRIRQMLAFAGATSAFPIMAPSREAAPTADWLVAALGDAAGARARVAAALERRADVPTSTSFRLTEWDFPGVLPHDLMPAPDGRIVVTGMLTHVMQVLEPETGAWEKVAIPGEAANPRALEIDPQGRWWVLLGAPRAMARHDPATGEWTRWNLGMYPHSVMRDADGRIWFNGHFTRAPELIGALDPAAGTVTTFEVPTPPMPDGGSTIPYGLRVGPDGRVWGTQLAGNRLVRFDPDAGAFELHELPTVASGPRRPDVAPDGTVWIPQFASNGLARFDPVTGIFTEYAFPLPDALPYVARVDPARGDVWIGTAAGDVMARFDPAAAEFELFPLPTDGALIRHLAVDADTGAVWGAYSPSPHRRPRVFRLEAG